MNHTSYQEYEILLKQLHDLDKVGKLDTDEADKIREKMEDSWYALSEDEKNCLRDFSANLYSESK